MEIFRIQNLTYYYPGEEEPALEDIELSIKEGEFVLLLGRSGSGKSTLGRVFSGIVPEFYGGRIRGNIKRKAEAGIVFQDPEKQLLMDKVEREIAFGPENLGVEHGLMRKRVMEALNFLGIWDIRDKKTYELSGGQKQKIVIGATISMGYRFLVLDEPTSQLDPAAAEEILNILKKLNEDLGYTIILIEQRIDRCFYLADRVLFLEKGKLVFDGPVQGFISWNDPLKKEFLPSVSTFFLNLGSKNIPLTIKEGRRKLEELKLIYLKNPKKTGSRSRENPCSEKAVEIRDIYFTYENGKEALKGINLTVFKKEILGIMGGNGGGKSTLLKTISGLLKPAKGKLSVKGDVGYLSQDPNDYLFNDTVYEELRFTLDSKKIRDYSRIEKTLKELNIFEYKDKNPRDLSSGEKQRAALASILVMEPEILLLDEPTRGLDRELKDKLKTMILKFREKGKTVILVTHDVEFVGKLCDRVCLMFDGQIAQVGSKYDVLTSGIYYSTQMNKLFSGYAEEILTLEDALGCIRLLREGVL
ncbi:MAG: ATP-binding cassette domain-containing protein [Firmicutes bacterium]|jgi:energy-coupling factor transport system ATP-binding protein|nr:ATP-binding cassette domain-containing protein [Bacillota bacterium]